MDGTQPLLQRLHLSGCPKRISQAGWDWPSAFAWLELLGHESPLRVVRNPQLRTLSSPHPE